MNNTAKFRSRFWAITGAVFLFAFFGCSPLITSNQETPKNTCINNLRLLNGVKQQWALENQKTNSAVPTWGDLKIYYSRDPYYPPRCPSGGIYTIGAVSNPPSCSTPGHVLP